MENSIKFTFEMQETDAPKHEQKYTTKVKVEGGVPLRVAINALVHYLTDLTDLYDRIKKEEDLQLGESAPTTEKS